MSDASPKTAGDVYRLGKEAMELRERTYNLSLLGRCIVSWSMLHERVNLLMAMLLNDRGLDLESTEMVVSNIELRQASRIIVALGCSRPVSANWKLHAHSISKEIIGAISDKRNRLFHDQITWGDSSFVRRKTVGTSVKRPKKDEFFVEVPAAALLDPEELKAFLADLDRLIVGTMELAAQVATGEWLNDL